MENEDKLTFTSDGYDVVIWRGEDFGCNVGSNRMAPVDVETVAFDGEVKFAEQMCKRWNAYEKDQHRISKLEEAIKDAAKTFAMLNEHTHPNIELDGTADGLASVLGGFDAIHLREELKLLYVQKTED